MNLHVQSSWQAQHFVNLHVQISWQAHYLVNLHVQISWQAQRFVNLHASPNLDGKLRGTTVARRSRVMLGSFSDHARVMLGIAPSPEVLVVVQISWQAQRFVNLHAQSSEKRYAETCDLIASHMASHTHKETGHTWHMPCVKPLAARKNYPEWYRHVNPPNQEGHGGGISDGYQVA